MRSTFATRDGRWPTTATRSVVAWPTGSSTTRRWTHCAYEPKRLASASMTCSVPRATMRAHFTDWLEGPAPAGAHHGINRYVFYRVVRERPDVMRAYPDLDGPDGAEYAAWCWAFGREEMAIPDRFLPPRVGDAITAAPTAMDERQPPAAEPEVSAPGLARGGRIVADALDEGHGQRLSPDRAGHRLPRSHTRPGRSSTRLRAGAARRGRAGEHRERARCTM